MAVRLRVAAREQVVSQSKCCHIHGGFTVKVGSQGGGGLDIHSGIGDGSCPESTQTFQES